SCLYHIALIDHRSLVVAVALVSSLEFCQVIGLLRSVLLADPDLLGCGALNSSRPLCNQAYTGVYISFYFHTCSDYRSRCCKSRHGLTLHVGPLEGTVRFVVLQERDQGCSHGECHLRGYIHVIQLISFIFLCLFAVTTGYIFVDKMSFLIQR